MLAYKNQTFNTYIFIMRFKNLETMVKSDDQITLKVGKYPPPHTHTLYETLQMWP